MPNAYTLASPGVTLTNHSPVTLLFLNPPAAPNLQLAMRRFWVGQINSTAPAQQGVQVHTQVTAFPTLTSQTPARTSIGNNASILTGGTAGAAGTSGINATVEGAGTKTIIWPDAFNPANGWILVLTPQEVFEAQAGSASGLGLGLVTAPATLTSWVFGASWTED